jgi:hypothetical protein
VKDEFNVRNLTWGGGNYLHLFTEDGFQVFSKFGFIVGNNTRPPKFHDYSYPVCIFLATDYPPNIEILMKAGPFTAQEIAEILIAHELNCSIYRKDFSY